ncbi:MAG: hypothetical protein ABIH23_16125 [bacterium]
MNRPLIAWYISSHGFGHASRTCAVVEHVPSEIEIELVTDVPRWLFDCSLHRPFGYRKLRHDPGLIQLNCTEFDPEATANTWRHLLSDYPQIADEEAERYRTRSPLVVGDISPLAVLVAERLGTGSVCVANFSWDWILEPSVPQSVALREVQQSIAEIYQRCGLLLRTPFRGDLSVFPEVRDVGLVVRRPTLSRLEAREHFDLPLDKPIVLISFGGHNQEGVTPEILERYPDIHFIRIREDCPAPNFHVFPSETYHPNLVAASDIVFCKLGYGIVGEALASDTDLLHLERHGFPEHEIFEEQLPQYLHLRKISRTEFQAGAWDGLHDLLSVRNNRPPQSPYSNLMGGAEAAKILCDLIE